MDLTAQYAEQVAAKTQDLGCLQRDRTLKERFLRKMAYEFCY
jgi:hypothetical protein